MNIRIISARIYALGIVVLSAWVLHGFAQGLLAASVAAIASWPLYVRFAARLPKRMPRSTAPMLFTSLVTVFVLAPMLFAIWALLGEAQTAVREILVADAQGIAAPTWLVNLPLLGPWAAARWQSDVAHPGALLVSLQHADPKGLVSWAQSLGQFAGRHALILVFSILLLFFFYQEGGLLGRDLKRVLRHAVGERAKRYLDVVTRAVRASVMSMLVVGLFDGIVTSLLLAIAGAPHPAEWGAIIGALAALPFLGYAALGALALRLAIEGQGALGLLCVALGAVVLLIGDKVLRPSVAREGMHLPFVWVLMGCIGGFEALGLVGLVVGPVVLALARELWDERVRTLPPDDTGRDAPFIPALSRSSCEARVPTTRAFDALSR
jgi:predicted PurR-regulated permease PerM